MKINYFFFSSSKCLKFSSGLLMQVHILGSYSFETYVCSLISMNSNPGKLFIHSITFLFPNSYSSTTSFAGFQPVHILNSNGAKLRTSVMNKWEDSLMTYSQSSSALLLSNNCFSVDHESNPGTYACQSSDEIAIKGCSILNPLSRISL
jgi:hypothetical protein